MVSGPFRAALPAAEEVAEQFQKGKRIEETTYDSDSEGVSKKHFHFRGGKEINKSLGDTANWRLNSVVAEGVCGDVDPEHQAEQDKCGHRGTGVCLNLTGAKVQEDSIRMSVIYYE